LILKKNSNNLLKNTIRKIRSNQYRLPQLYEKLEYYEVKMIGYNSSSFEPKYSSNQPTYQSNLDYWLEKIWVIEEKIERIELDIKRFNSFISKLEDLEKFIVEGLIKQISVKQIIKENNIHRQTYYYYIKKIDNKIYEFKFKKL